MNDPALLESLRTAIWVPAGGVVVALVWRAWKVARDAGTWKTRGVWVAAASAAAVLLFAGAAHNPRLWKAPPTFPRIVLLLDVSHSVLRGNGGWEGMRKAVEDRLGALTVDVSTENRKKITVTIVACGGASSELPETTLAELLEKLGKIREPDLVPGGASDLGGGLSKARDSLNGKPGLILLFSDGLETNNGARTAAQALAANGVEVHTFPLSSGPAVEGLTAFDLPPSAQRDKEIMLRSMIAGPDSLAGTIAVNFAPRRGERAPPAAVPQTLGPGLLPTPLIFGEHGLQCAQVMWHVSGGTVSQCLYTYVHHTPEVLCIGDASALTKVLDHRPARIVPRTPSEVRPEDIASDRFDAVVIDGVLAGDLPSPVQEAIVAAHERSGIGLLFINGPVSGGRVKESLLASYAKSPLTKLLPIRAEARELKIPLERRDAIFLLDVSGSMGPEGPLYAQNPKKQWVLGLDGLRNPAVRLSYAKGVLKNVVQQLQPKDHLFVLPYAGGKKDALKYANMSPQSKALAQRDIDQLGVSADGTSILEALEQVHQWDIAGELKDPKLFFITDGEIQERSAAWIPPFPVELVIVGPSQPTFETMPTVLRDSRWPQQPIFPTCNADGIVEVIRLEEKIPKQKTVVEWQDPSPLQPQREPTTTLPVPAAALPGSAFAVLTPGATTIASRPGTKDPVLAERRSEAGGALALASGIPSEALQEGELQEAVWSWVESLLPTDRYELRAEVRGDDIVLEIAPKPRRERGAEESLEVTWKSLDPEAIYSERRTLRRADDSPDTFRGVFPLRPLRAMVQGRLKIEDGRDTAYVQMALPSTAATSVSLNAAENRLQGRDDDLLKKVSEVTGGTFDPRRLPAFSPEEDAGREIWKELCALGVVAYLAAIWKRDWTPWGGK
jgi:hypothetical protein